MSASPRNAVNQVRDAGRTQAVIIGGGINGIAAFRDLALQGVEVVLVERGDFASGASAASSHMVHGGIRYLENGEFRLVRESVRERNDLLKTAPHFVKPLKTTVPIYSFWSGLLQAPMKFVFGRKGKPAERGAALIKVGLTMYDLFVGPTRRTPWHRFRGRAASLRELPRLNPDIKFTATYFDASMHDPERLALDVLTDGIKSNRSAHALNYVEATGFTGDGVTVRDLVSGEEFALAADVVVNATGPWADLTNAALGTPTRFMGGTKGSHIVLDNPELVAATGGREIFFEHSDGRIVLIYPLKGRAMVGTTDIEADPSEPARCTEQEVDYFLDLINDVFPDVAVSRDEIVYRFSGIRPLPASDESNNAQISRDYRVVVDSSRGIPLVTLVGGKWTTFRSLGETLLERRARPGRRAPSDLDTRAPDRRRPRLPDDPSRARRVAALARARIRHPRIRAARPIRNARGARVARARGSRRRADPRRSTLDVGARVDGRPRAHRAPVRCRDAPHRPRVHRFRLPRAAR